MACFFADVPLRTYPFSLSLVMTPYVAVTTRFTASWKQLTVAAWFVRVGNLLPFGSWLFSLFWPGAAAPDQSVASRFSGWFDRWSCRNNRLDRDAAAPDQSVASRFSGWFDRWSCGNNRFDRDAAAPDQSVASRFSGWFDRWSCRNNRFDRVQRHPINLLLHVSLVDSTDGHVEIIDDPIFKIALCTTLLT